MWTWYNCLFVSGESLERIFERSSSFDGAARPVMRARRRSPLLACCWWTWKHDYELSKLSPREETGRTIAGSMLDCLWMCACATGIDTKLGALGVLRASTELWYSTPVAKKRAFSFMVPRVQRSRERVVGKESGCYWMEVGGKMVGKRV